MTALHYHFWLLLILTCFLSAYSTDFSPPTPNLDSSGNEQRREGSSTNNTLPAAAVRTPSTTAEEPSLAVVQQQPPPPSPRMTMIVHSCLLHCKDNHMHESSSESEWSLNFVFPLLTIMRSRGSQRAMVQHVGRMCRTNLDMKTCLAGCPASVENDILQIGIDHPWGEICSNLRDFQTQFPCWRENVQNLTGGCFIESNKMRNGVELLTRNQSVAVIDTICADFRSLALCFTAEYGRHCGHMSEKLVGQVFGSSFEAVRKMLMLKWGDLPRNCRIGSEEQEGEEGEGEEMETPAISMNGPKSFLKEAFLAINGTANSAAAGQWSAAVVKILGGRTMFFVATAALAVVNLACFL